MYVVTSWIQTPYSVVGGNERFGGTYCLHRQCKDVLYFEDIVSMFLRRLSVHVPDYAVK
jgi:hypothetical protein